MKRFLFAILCIFSLSACSYNKVADKNLSAKYTKQFPLDVAVANITAPYFFTKGISTYMSPCTGVYCTMATEQRREALEQKQRFYKKVKNVDDIIRTDYSHLLQKQKWMNITELKAFYGIDTLSGIPTGEKSELTYTGYDYFKKKYGQEHLRGQIANFYRMSEKFDKLQHIVRFQIQDSKGLGIPIIYLALVGDVYKLQNATNNIEQNMDLWAANNGAEFKEAVKYLHSSVEEKFAARLSEATN